MDYTPFRVICYACLHAKSLQLCLTLCNPINCSLPGSSVHGILQARVLVWVAIWFSRGFSQPMSLMSPVLTGRFFTANITRVAPCYSAMGNLYTMTSNGDHPNSWQQTNQQETPKTIRKSLESLMTQMLRSSA